MASDPRQKDAQSEEETSGEAWCEHCSRIVSVNAARADGSGTCPLCGARVVIDREANEPPKAPWHFKVLLLATIGYLIYRLVWFIFWLTGHAWNG